MMRSPEQAWASARSALTVFFWVMLGALLFSALASLITRALFMSLRDGPSDFESILRMVSVVGVLRALVSVTMTIFAILAFARLAAVPAPSVKGVAAGAMVTAIIVAVFDGFDILSAAHQLADRGKPLISDDLADYVWYASSAATLAMLVAGFIVALAVTRLFKAPQPVVFGALSLAGYALHALLPIVMFKIIKTGVFHQKNPWVWTLMLTALLAMWGVLFAITMLRARDAIPVRRGV